MQTMKVEKDDAMDKADESEQKLRCASARQTKLEEELEELIKKSHCLELEVGRTTLELELLEEKLEEKEKSLNAAELEVGNLDRWEKSFSQALTMMQQASAGIGSRPGKMGRLLTFGKSGMKI